MESRREFLGIAIPVAATGTVLPASARVVGANDRINAAVIGLGSMGLGHVHFLKKYADETGRAQVTALCDIYTKRKQHAREFLGLPEKSAYHDYREMLARTDIDAVFVATPDHWHFQMAMDALRAGKDVYVQKPMTYRVEEAGVIADYVRQSGRVLQVGSQYASEEAYDKGREAIGRGLIGKPLWAQGTYCRNSYHGDWDYKIDDEGTPENIDWKRFLGPAPKRPFSQDRFFRWRKYWDYSGGIATDLLYHRLVPLLAALGPQFPVRVSANGGIYVHKDREVPDTISTTIEYKDFQVIMSATGAASIPASYLRTVIYGHEGTIEFLHDHLLVTPEPIFAKRFQEKTGQKELRIEAGFGDLQRAHMENFFDCVRSRKPPRLNAEFGYQVMVAIGLGGEAYRTSRQMLFDTASLRDVPHAPKREGYEGTGMDGDESKPA